MMTTLNNNTNSFLKYLYNILCIQAVTRHVWAAWEAGRPAVRSVPAVTGSEDPNVLVGDKILIDPHLFLNISVCPLINVHLLLPPPLLQT